MGAVGAVTGFVSGHFLALVQLKGALGHEAARTAFPYFIVLGLTLERVSKALDHAWLCSLGQAVLPGADWHRVQDRASSCAQMKLSLLLNRSH